MVSKITRYLNVICRVQCTDLDKCHFSQIWRTVGILREIICRRTVYFLREDPLRQIFHLDTEPIKKGELHERLLLFS